MSYLVDTCVLLRAFERDAPEHPAIVQAIRKAYENRVTLFVTVQNIAEFWNVATRPTDNNGLGLSVERTARRIRIVERFATVLAETAASYLEWKRLVVELGVLGVKVHDARLVSVMNAEGISRLLTLNVADFRRYTGIATQSPADALKELVGEPGS